MAGREPVGELRGGKGRPEAADLRAPDPVCGLAKTRADSAGVPRSDRSFPARLLTVAMVGRFWGHDNGFAKTYAHGDDAGVRKGTARQYSRSVILREFGDRSYAG
jgi:hypothetical protein